MINRTGLFLDAFIERLRLNYGRAFGRNALGELEPVEWLAHVVIEQIADSDALYHDIEHTAMVTLVGQEILYGKKLVDGRISSAQWLNLVAATLCHDIGYVRGVCVGDGAGSFVVDTEGTRAEPPRGASDAWLGPYHVDRSKLFVRERLEDFGPFDVQLVMDAIERTRTPVPPDAKDAQQIGDLPGLVRAADLIGQLADPHYMRKINRLFHEFQETGMNQKLGYQTAADLAEGYPLFYWKVVRPYIAEGLNYLTVTQRGKQWIANLTSHVFAAEHREFQLGPNRAASATRTRIRKPE